MTIKQEDHLSKEYTLLFNAVTDTIQKLNSLTETLTALQQQAEEYYISKEETETSSDFSME